MSRPTRRPDGNAGRQAVINAWAETIGHNNATAVFDFAGVLLGVRREHIGALLTLMDRYDADTVTDLTEASIANAWQDLTKPEAEPPR